jgi:hypothetical protein
MRIALPWPMSPNLLRSTLADDAVATAPHMTPNRKGNVTMVNTPGLISCTRTLAQPLAPQLQSIAQLHLVPRHSVSVNDALCTTLRAKLPTAYLEGGRELVQRYQRGWNMPLLFLGGPALHLRNTQSGNTCFCQTEFLTVMGSWYCADSLAINRCIAASSVVGTHLPRSPPWRKPSLPSAPATAQAGWRAHPSSTMMSAPGTAWHLRMPSHTALYVMTSSCQRRSRGSCASASSERSYSDSCDRARPA